MESNPTHLFVYGTLLTAFDAGDRPTLRGWAELVDTGSVPGLLYDTGEYPAAVPVADENTLVRGELHSVPADRLGPLLEILDVYEQYFPSRRGSSLFIRHVVNVSRDSGGVVPAWIYVYNRPVDRLRLIESGDYLASTRGDARG
jgi:gamma-glutamylcyclotransferase (GGCT)/AIG2-like uncharacterized protein YtfP